MQKILGQQIACLHTTLATTICYAVGMKEIILYKSSGCIEIRHANYADFLKNHSALLFSRS